MVGADRGGNADFDWDDFGAGEYHAHNYLSLRADDAEILARVRAWFDVSAAESADLVGIDVGAGPNLYPALAMLPHCRSLTFWEYSSDNVAWLREQTQRPGQYWRPFWDAVSPAGSLGTFEEAGARLADMSTVQQDSIFALPQAQWDIGTMFFVAESITTEKGEFRRATTRFVEALRPGAPFAAAFMEKSDGWASGAKSFPAYSVTRDNVLAALDSVSTELLVTVVGINPAPLRAGYSGMIVATGRVK